MRRHFAGLRIAALSFAMVAAAPPHAAEPLGPADFAAVFPLAGVAEGMHSVELTEAVYRAATSRALADLRVFNAQGEALPLAVLPAPPPAEPHVRVVDLTLAALPARADARDAALRAYALRFERDRQRAVIEITGGEPAAPSVEGNEVGGYLIDARPLKDARGRLLLVFAPNAPDYAGRAQVLGSEDLVNWRVLASAPLAWERRLGDVIEKGRFDLDRPPSFLRVAWAGDAVPRIGGARFEVLTPAAAELPRARLGTSLGEDGRSLYVEVPQALPIEQLLIRVPQANQSLRVTVYRHVSDPAPRSRHLGLVPRRAPEHWVAAGALDVFRVMRDGVEIEGAPLAFSVPTDRVRIDAPAPWPQPLPTVEAEWRPARIAFAARAPGPYRLAVGHDGAPPSAALDLRALLPEDDRAGMRLPSARLEPQDGRAAAPERGAQRIAAAAHWSRALLWVVLAAAVAGLAWMAWRLAAQLRRAEQKTPGPDA